MSLNCLLVKGVEHLYMSFGCQPPTYKSLGCKPPMYKADVTRNDFYPRFSSQQSLRGKLSHACVTGPCNEFWH